MEGGRVKSFADGVLAARDELARHPLSRDELMISLGLFVYDPPDSPFQRGYMRMIKTAYGRSPNERSGSR